jgi:hypothetical protein
MIELLFCNSTLKQNKYSDIIYQFSMHNLRGEPEKSSLPGNIRIFPFQIIVSQHIFIRDVSSALGN